MRKLLTTIMRTVKALKLLYFICTTILVLGTCYICYKFKCESSLEVNVLIPNIIHYILFDKSTLDFITYLSILSVIKVQKPSVIYIHANKQNFSGKYWDNLLHISSKNKINIQISFLIQPTHVYGQRLSSVYHTSDVSRLFVLRLYGGIYLDTDMLMINNVNNLRKYDCVIGWPKKDYVGSQFIMAKNNSKFLKKWQEGYKKYKPRDWYYNAGRYPTELLEKNPELAHIETELFGVQNLLDRLLSTEKWLQWRQYYGIHVLYRHNQIFKNLDEVSVQELPINFGDIAKWILELGFS